MKTILIPDGRKYKTDLHTHSNKSDGRWSVEEIKEKFMARGYDAVAFTDHEVMFDNSHLTDKDFVALKGYEYNIMDFGCGIPYCKRPMCHFNLFAMDENSSKHIKFSEKCLLEYTKKGVANYNPEIKICGEEVKERIISTEFVNDFTKEASEEGFLVSFNHPMASLAPIDLMLRFENLWGIEVYNGTDVAGGHPGHDVFYTEYLRNGRHAFVTAGSDFHCPIPDWQDCLCGWVSVWADKLEYGSLMKALKAGNFYASSGPEIREAFLEDNRLTVKCSPVKNITIFTNHNYRKIKDVADGTLTEYSFELNELFNPYFRIVITDLYGKQAFSNPFYNMIK